MNIDTPRPIHIPALKKLWYEAFGDTEEFVNLFFSTAFSADRCRVVKINEEIVAALYWFDCLHIGRPIAYLYAVATAQAYRGQGICHKLMTDTHEYLSMLDYEGSILVPGNKQLFRLYEGMKYQTCSYIREFCCDSAKTGIQLHRIHKFEYATLRQMILPKGGVVQEGVNLDFLQTQARFYTGPGFLLAAREEADTLYGVELLGDISQASGIVHALGYSKGFFRTPGKGMPFAMFHVLRDSSLPSPTYFGLAFD